MFFLYAILCFECRCFIPLHECISVLCFKWEEHIYLLCVRVDCVCVCVCICGWKTYDMWQLVGRCHRGGRKQRGELLLPWRPHRVAHGRVAWSRNQLREKQLNNRTRERREKERKKLIHIYRTKQRAEAFDGVTIPRSWHLHNANIQPTQKRDEIRNLFRYKCDRSGFESHYAHIFIHFLFLHFVHFTIPVCLLPYFKSLLLSKVTLYLNTNIHKSFLMHSSVSSAFRFWYNSSQLLSFSYVVFFFAA